MLATIYADQWWSRHWSVCTGIKQVNVHKIKLFIDEKNAL